MKYSTRFSLIFLGIIPFNPTPGQGLKHQLSLRQALDSGFIHFELIKNKKNIENSRFESIKTVQSEYLPDLSFSSQQDYGTVNSSFGPFYSFRGASISSSGPARFTSSWNAAFGALYLTNFQWDFFAFGKSKQKIKLTRQLYYSSKSDYDQTVFEQNIKISAAYFNLLAAQSLLKSQKANLGRALQVRKVVVSRVRSGLNPGVDSSITNAQVSNARFLILTADQTVNDYQNILNLLMGVRPQKFELDTLFESSIPKILDTLNTNLAKHPTLLYYNSLIQIRNQNIFYLKKTELPVFTFFSIFQSRGSGFRNTYGDAHPQDFSPNYFTGINPVRDNYLIGLGVFWNFTNTLRVHHQIREEQYLVESLENNYNLAEAELKGGQNLSNQRINNARKQYQEGPIQVEAASKAYLQKLVLFKNGLSSIVDVSQTLFALNQAETQLAISYNNVWTALLLKSASNGEFDQFLNQVPQ